VVTVYVRAPGVQVRTAARSRDTGSQGELISVESLENRQTYFARVTGIQEAEVYARGQSAM
jgi:flagella basal body P-ring formation protein FlgA